MRRVGHAAAVAALAWLTPALALACPVCIGANEANRDAFLLSTVFMSLVPLAMIGGLVGFLVLRARRAGESDGAALEITPSASAEGAPIAATTDRGDPR